MSDGACIIVKVGGAGGSVMLVGRRTDSGQWRFARVTVDQSGELLGETDAKNVSDAPLEWVDSWEEGLRLLDRYPWVRLHPMEVHPAFVERVRAGVEGRLSLIPDLRERERARERWARLVRMATD